MSLTRAQIDPVIADPPGGVPGAVSVIVPNYNHAHFLPQAVASHLGQTLMPLEVVVIDDGSTDDSERVLTGLCHSDPRVRVVRHASNLGVNAAMNTGLAAARGEFVCFCAADDRVTPEFLEHCAVILRAHPEAGLCFSDPAELDDETGSTRGFPLYLSIAPRLFDPGELGTLLERNFFSIPSHATLYRREKLRALGGFDPALRWHADWFANYHLGFRFGACYVPEILAYFRVSPDSYSTQRMRDEAAQQSVMVAMLTRLAIPENRDLFEHFSRCGILPEHSMRVLRWLREHPAGAEFLSQRLVQRLVMRDIWQRVMPMTPVQVRRLFRWLTGARTRRSLHRA